ncbi:MAG: SHOCT domain-containing protein [Vallitaleaceae bacterium]|jgi:uncharacterized membrane protein|nr:SHOCT domain-containing protein [Vallitaleaceae bacterium]
MFIGLILIIVILVWVFGKKPYMNGNMSHHMDTQTTALEALNTRYINGEIDEETYVKMKKNIMN